MQHNRAFQLARLLLALLISALSLATLASATDTEKVLYTFSGGDDGGTIYPNVVMDSKGDLYGTASGGGRYGSGTFYELKKTKTGWKQTVLYNFNPGSSGDGAYPNCIAFDAKGNLWGTTYSGGADGLGTVFEFQSSGGKWTEKVVYSFGTNGGGDAAYPTLVRLVFDKKGNVYGTTTQGGNDNQGAAYEVTPSGTETVLYSFTGGTDGGLPDSGLTFDSKGNLYGATDGGGTYSFGTVYQLKKKSKGWVESVLYSFAGGNDGANPAGPLLADSAGNLYGTTYDGNPTNQGTVFELMKLKKGWKEAIVHAFQGADGSGPNAPFAVDKSGALYTTTLWGGSNGDGTVYKLAHSKSGWKGTTLYSFQGGSDGINPDSGVVLNKSDDIFGSTANGGSSGCGGGGCGTIFELIP